MRYVEIDASTGAVRWDAYFDYLKTVRAQFSPELYAYASDWKHYSLDSKDSLHDAWVLGINFPYRGKEVVLELLGPHRDRKHVLKYVGVSACVVNFDIEYRHGDRDVLAHEFRIEKDLVVHEIALAGANSITVTSKDIIPKIEMMA
jgi:hypothetical protein